MSARYSIYYTRWRQHWRLRISTGTGQRGASGAHFQKFSKVDSLLNLLCKMTIELTFKKFCQWRTVWDVRSPLPKILNCQLFCHFLQQIQCLVNSVNRLFGHFFSNLLYTRKSGLSSFCIVNAVASFFLEEFLPMEDMWDVYGPVCKNSHKSAVSSLNWSNSGASWLLRNFDSGGIVGHLWTHFHPEVGPQGVCVCEEKILVAHMNESCYTCAWVLSHMLMRLGTCMNKACHTYEWVTSQIWGSHVTHMNEE